MRIAQLSLAGRGAWPDLHIEQLHPQLNVFFGKPGAGKSTVAQLVNHLLYGKSQSPWRQQFGQTVPLTEGRLVVDSSHGNFVLRRHVDGNRTSRLTVSAVGGGAVDSRTVQKLLSDLSPQVIAQLVAVDFAEAPSVYWLLGKDFTRELAKTRGKNTNCPEARLSSSENQIETTSLDRRRIDELIRQRDAIAESIEKQLSVRRQEGGVLTNELADIESQLEATRRLREGSQSDLQVVAGEIAVCETRLRYLSLETMVTRQGAQQDQEIRRQELSHLEGEIANCRKALSDLQARDAVIRAELARLTSDGTTERTSHLADSRATIGVLEKLVGDLDAEIALLARAHDPGRCIHQDAHSTLSPVAAMLRQQVYTLCGLLTQQERQSRRQQVAVESRQVSRAQLDLSERLEHLLSRRETLVHELGAVGQPHLLRPQSPVVDHCHCENHADFVSHADPLLAGYVSRHPQEADLRNHYENLLKRQNELQIEAKKLTDKLANLEGRWQDVQRERAGLVGNASLEEQRFELERLELTIREALKPVAHPTVSAQENWRASDILAQLTNGKLVQIRLEREGRAPVVIDHLGRAHELGELSTEAHDQLYLSLTLALVGSFSRRGIQLPLILDEPFLRLDAASSAAMAGVLAEFARASHQVIVFTEDLDALRRFESLNASVFDLASLRRQAIPEPKTEVATTETFTRVVRETEDGVRTPVLQFRAVGGNSEPQYYLTEERSLAEFPVLGSGTTEAFSKIKIVSVGQLLAADAGAIATQLNRKQITTDTVALWQSHMRLMCSVPGLTLNDAQVLTACGIRSFTQLRDAVPIELEATIREFLKSDRGQRFAGSASHFNASQIREWSHLGTHAKKPPSQQPLSAPTSTTLKERRPTVTRLKPRTSSRGEPQFYLNRGNQVADAPSIGPQAANNLTSVGIRTVADLLNANPASTAAELGLSHVTAATIADWQLQARLMCQIPDLRGFGAQLLVAAGFTSPEQIAGTRPADLIRKVKAVCESKQGQRILRNGEIPSPAKIKRWAENAAHRRPLEAA
jgi:energy-coupling factor transporter ATP-binding protein EcfA2